MDFIRKTAERAREASYRLQGLPATVRNAALAAIVSELAGRRQEIVSANRIDLANAARDRISPVLAKRLDYGDFKVDESIESLNALVRLDDPVGRVLARTELDEELILEKVSCPIGVIGVVFESRPDALIQISTLCIKSGNAVILKGGSEASHTNKILADIITDAVTSVDGRFESAVQTISTREEFRELLRLDDLVDLIIPRGSNELVRLVKEATRIPVLGHAAGICHVYVDAEADIEMALKICYDAKVQYPAVCNAMETLLVHKDVAAVFLPRMAERYEKAGVEMRGDIETRQIIDANPASDKDWSTEYNDLILSIKIVYSLEEVVDNINRYGSHHTDAIVTGNPETAKRFMDEIDSSSVLWNCSTRFADGYRYGLGAEVGISTNKTHARGPVGLEGLVIYKYRLSGRGHVVSDYVGSGAKRFTHRSLL